MKYVRDKAKKVLGEDPTSITSDLFFFYNVTETLYFVLLLLEQPHYL